MRPMGDHTASETGTPPIRVAIIDDSSDVRFLLSTMMEMDGRFEIVGEAEDAPSGVELVATVEPDLVLVDLHLGRRDGTWLINKVRRLNHDVALALVTSSTAEGDHADALDAGADSVHDKKSMTTTMADDLIDAVNKRRGTPRP